MSENKPANPREKISQAVAQTLVQDKEQRKKEYEEGLQAQASAEELLLKKLENLGLTLDSDQQEIIDAIAQGLPVKGWEGNFDFDGYVHRWLIRVIQTDERMKNKLSAIELMMRMKGMIQQGHNVAVAGVHANFGKETGEDEKKEAA